MQMSGTRQLNATQAEVWRKLNDPAVLQRCIPGCESLEKVGDNGFKGIVAVRLGPMALKFSGDVTLENMDPPKGYRIKGSGKAGPAGFASGHADVTLAPQEGGTLLSYNVESQVGGKIAQLGSRLVDATAAQIAEQFFTKFTTEIEGPPPPVSAPAVASETAPPAAGPARAAIPSWVWWLAALVVAVAALYYLLMPR